MKNTNKINMSAGDRIFTVINYFLLTVATLIIAYPLYYVVLASFSDTSYANSGSLLLYPKGFSLLGYKYILKDSRILTGYFNTIVYTVGGTLFGLIICLPAGYALSRKDLPGRGFVMLAFVFTWYFNGGLIPTYMVVKTLGMTNTRYIIILLSCVSIYNIILIRTFFLNSLPMEIQEAASIEGCGNARFFIMIALPLAKAIIAVVALQMSVGYWNSYFNALIYLTDTKKYPLQLFLREMLLVSTSVSDTDDPELQLVMAKLVQVTKYCVIVISSAPIICMYPFLQKYFVHGVMIGSIKG